MKEHLPGLGAKFAVLAGQNGVLFRQLPEPCVLLAQPEILLCKPLNFVVQLLGFRHLPAACSVLGTVAAAIVLEFHQSLQGPKTISTRRAGWAYPWANRWGGFCGARRAQKV